MQGQQDRTGGHLLPSCLSIQTLCLRPRGQCGHLRPQHGALHLQGKGGGAPVQQVMIMVPGWGWERCPFPGWDTCWVGVFMPMGHCCFPSPYIWPLAGALWWESRRVTPHRGHSW